MVGMRSSQVFFQTTARRRPGIGLHRDREVEGRGIRGLGQGQAGAGKGRRSMYAPVSGRAIDVLWILPTRDSRSSPHTHLVLVLRCNVQTATDGEILNIATYYMSLMSYLCVVAIHEGMMVLCVLIAYTPTRQSSRASGEARQGSGGARPALRGVRVMLKRVHSVQRWRSERVP